MVVYTSITKSYMPKARVLAKSVKKFHPNWHFVLLYSDLLPDGFDLKNEPFDEVMTLDQLQIPNWKSWAFGHALVELCTAVKGPAAKVLAGRQGVDKIMYLDPDIKVYSSLSDLEKQLDSHQILLTPHLLTCENDIHAIQDNEISALKHGIYNLGFFAARTTGQGLDFISWWSSRLLLFCKDDIPNGLFTDQRWCDLAPAFFSDLHIVRDPGYNVATWNIAHRALSKSTNGAFMVGNVRLKFYHFTSYDNGYGLGMLQKYATNQSVANDLWRDYGTDLENEGHGDKRYKSWDFNTYSDATSISLGSRRVYRSRKDLQLAFPNPYEKKEPSFFAWWTHEVRSGRIDELGQYNVSTGYMFKSAWQKFVSSKSSRQFFKRVFAIIKSEGLAGILKRARNENRNA
ncbi:MAG: glycosyl transferase [Bdellovibrionaceae bacterium]|nr:glycosyl transferase [Pseudobdellovibrionaceae bacterium]